MSVCQTYHNGNYLKRFILNVFEDFLDYTTKGKEKKRFRIDWSKGRPSQSERITHWGSNSIEEVNLGAAAVCAGEGKCHIVWNCYSVGINKKLICCIVPLGKNRILCICKQLENIWGRSNKTPTPNMQTKHFSICLVGFRQKCLVQTCHVYSLIILDFTST